MQASTRILFNFFFVCFRFPFFFKRSVPCVPFIHEVGERAHSLHAYVLHRLAVVVVQDGNVFIYSLICDIDFIMVISDRYLDTRVCLYSSAARLIIIIIVSFYHPLIDNLVSFIFNFYYLPFRKWNAQWNIRNLVAHRKTNFDIIYELIYREKSILKIVWVIVN